MGTPDPPPYFQSAFTPETNYSQSHKPEKAENHQGSYVTEEGSRSNNPSQLVYQQNIGFVPLKYGFWEDRRRNKPQLNSLAAATLILISGGMNLAWSIGFGPGFYYWNDRGTGTTHLQICWFAAVIIGTCFSAFLIDQVPMRTFNLIASVLVIINGIILVSRHNDEDLLAFARYCDGIAVGLTILPAIVTGSEQSVPRFRGMVLSFEHIGLVTGMVMKTTVSSVWDISRDFSSTQMQGVLSLIFGCLAMGLAFFQTIETASFYLRKGMEPEAIDSLRRLQVPQTVTNETLAMLNESKFLLEEDATRGRSLNISTGFVPMVKLCLYRILVSMSVSTPLTWCFFFTSHQDLGPNSWNLYLYALPRMTGVLFAALTIDRLGRKILSAVFLGVAGFLMIAIGISFHYYENFTVPWALLLIYQFFGGVAAPASTCYLGEAFSKSVKPYFILVAVIIENVVQIIVCSTFQSLRWFLVYGYVVGVMQVSFAIVIYVALPETKQKTLRQALSKFQKIVSVVRR